MSHFWYRKLGHSDRKREEKRREKKEKKEEERKKRIRSEVQETKYGNYSMNLYGLLVWKSHFV